MNKKSMRNAAALGGALFIAVIALVLTACFIPPAPIRDHNDTNDKPLAAIEIAIGVKAGAARSLSPQLAEEYMNYVEIIFVDTTKSSFYRITGAAKQLLNQQLKMKVPAGMYDNADSGNKAIMLAGVRDLRTGECTLLATGVIDTVYEGSTEFKKPEITGKTTGVLFRLTALTADISDSPDSAFQVDPPDPNNYGTTKIAGVTHPYFKIKTATIKDGTIDEATTDAHLTLTGWGADTMEGENNTQRFIHLVHEEGKEFGLPGIGINTGEGDGPLANTADIQWKLTNTPGAMTGNNTSINITFTSKSTEAEYSGMGWLPVLVPVKAFGPDANTQVWHVGSGILWNQLDAGAETEGAGIVILHGEKIFNIEIGGPGPGPGPGNPGVVTPQASPVAGMYTAAQSVTLTSGTSGAEIWYTTNGSTPSKTNGTKYAGAISISQTTTLKAIAVKTGMTNSGVLTAVYTILDQVEMPQESPAAGEYPAAQSVTLTSGTSGAEIWYTTDDSEPAQSSGTLYSTGAPIVINQTTTLKAIAVKTGMTDSAVLTAVYTINLQSQGTYRANYTAGASETVTVGLTTTITPAAGKGILMSIESVDGSGNPTNKLNDGLGNTGKIYIGRASGTGTVNLNFEDTGNGTYTLKHRAKAGGAIPIGTYAEFQLIGKDVTTRGEAYKQEANLDLLGKTGSGAFGENPADRNWQPIKGANAEAEPDDRFSGVFDGNGKTIANLYANYANYPSYPSNSYIGLFGYLHEAEIRNLTMSGSLIGLYNCGGIAGAAMDSVITNCSFSGKVSGAAQIGGIAGFIYRSAITGCSNTDNTVTATDINTGGLVGSSTDSVITNCSFSGGVSGRQFAGGIAGHINGSTITGCSNTGGTVTANFVAGGLVGKSEGWTEGYAITACSNASAVSGSENVGGIVGFIQSDITITACYNTGTVSGSYQDVGGIVGWINQAGQGSAIIACYNTGTVSGGRAGNTGGVAGKAFNITACYNTGTVSGSGTGVDTSVGGIVGRAYSNITACYNTGQVSGNINVGGVVGLLSSGVVTACYWQTGTASAGISSGTGQTTSFPSGGFPAVTTTTHLAWGTGAGTENGWWKAGTTGGSGLPKLWFQTE